mgnify:CR=1 FL=1
MYLIDIGSSTIKLYKKDKDKDVHYISMQSYDFKHSLNSTKSLSEEAKSFLLRTILSMKNEYNLNNRNTKLFATGIFRKIKDKTAFIEEFYTQTGLYFNIISQELEAYFLESAWLDKYQKTHNAIIINIGGQSTEIILYYKGITERQYLEIGTKTINELYPLINKDVAEISINEITTFVQSKLQPSEIKFDTAIYTGGELNYMQLTGYNLKPNVIFADSKHPLQIDFSSYCQRNQEIFYNTNLQTLCDLMPENKTWMLGARACSAIAQAICSFYNIATIIPSDSNLIDGVCCREAKYVTICGSFNKHLKEIRQLIADLDNKGIAVLSPKSTNVVGDKDGFILFENDNLINNCTWSIEQSHLKAIENSDLVIICNYNGYVGLKTAFEIGYAHKCGKHIVFIEDNAVVNDFDIPCEVLLLNI